MSTPLDLMTFGHKGFMPNDEHRFYATDVYSAGKTVEYFAQQWGQWTNKLEDVVKVMVSRVLFNLSAQFNFACRLLNIGLQDVR